MKIELSKEEIEKLIYMLKNFDMEFGLGKKGKALINKLQFAWDMYDTL